MRGRAVGTEYNSGALSKDQRGDTLESRLPASRLMNLVDDGDLEISLVNYIGKAARSALPTHR